MDALRGFRRDLGIEEETIKSAKGADQDLKKDLQSPDDAAPVVVISTSSPVFHDVIDRNFDDAQRQLRAVSVDGDFSFRRAIKKIMKDQEFPGEYEELKTEIEADLKKRKIVRKELGKVVDDKFPDKTKRVKNEKGNFVFSKIGDTDEAERVLTLENTDKGFDIPLPLGKDTDAVIIVPRLNTRGMPIPGEKDLVRIQNGQIVEIELADEGRSQFDVEAIRQKAIAPTLQQVESEKEDVKRVAEAKDGKREAEGSEAKEEKAQGAATEKPQDAEDKVVEVKDEKVEEVVEVKDAPTGQAPDTEVAEAKDGEGEAKGSEAKEAEKAQDAAAEEAKDSKAEGKEPEETKGKKTDKPKELVTEKRDRPQGTTSADETPRPPETKKPKPPRGWLFL